MSKLKIILGMTVVIAVPLTLTAILVIDGFVSRQEANYNSALNATKKWARLNQFPVTATDITVKASGSMFTRGFRVTFVAPLEDINEWINQSPGTKDVVPTTTESVRKYEIDPGGGAQHAELKVDIGTGTVEIYVYWS